MRKPAISEAEFGTIQPGDEITYLLHPRLQPLNPEKEWHGRVKYVRYDRVMVTVIDEGYGDVNDTEFVGKTGIIAVKHKEGDWR